MGQLHLMRLVSMQRRRREAQAPSRNVRVASRIKRKRLPCQKNGDSEANGKKMYLGRNLPEDIWHHIHSLLPMRDAARAASVSRTFLHSWICHPTLTFSNESLGLNENACEKDGLASVFSSQVGHILANHSGIGLKTLQIHIPSYFDTKDCCYLDSWLQTALRAGIEELTLICPPMKAKYNFPHPLLCNGSGESIRYIHLVHCSFGPAATLGCLRSLTRLHLCWVHITGEEMERLLCNSLALERLEVRNCIWMVCLKVPCILKRLSYLEVFGNSMLQAIENEAPNLSSFLFAGHGGIRISLGETLQMKRLEMTCERSVFYSCTKLPSMMPNLESLTLRSDFERVTPVLGTKFLFLRHLDIALYGNSVSYDYLSLANFLDGAPLETFHLQVRQQYVEPGDQRLKIFAPDSSILRQMQEYPQHSLKSVTIKGFWCSKSLVELVCHVVESTTSLEYLILDTQAATRCCDRSNKSVKCLPMDTYLMNMDAHRAIMAIKRYIQPKIPSTVKLQALGPCSSCHAVYF